MFSKGSRYVAAPVYRWRLGDGREVTLVPFPVRTRPALLGYHRHEEDQRLDHLTAFYFKDATAFWRICDAHGAVSPHALVARRLIGIPVQED